MSRIRSQNGSQSEKPPTKPDAEPAARNVPTHRRCPVCFGGAGGVGDCYHTKRITDVTSERYYKCDQCSHTWTATVKSEVVEVNHRTVELKER